MEKPIFGAARNRQSSPRCIGVSPHGVIFTELDFPKMHYSPMGSLNASHWTIVYLGEVEFRNFDPVGGHPDASRRALTISVGLKDQFLIGPWSMYRARVRHPGPPNV